MGYPTLRLEADGMDPLVLDWTRGWAVTQLDLGDAATRAVTQDAPDADGTIDTTAYVGARTVALNVRLLTGRSGLSKEAMRRRLRAFTHPRLRPILYLRLDGMDEQRVVLRRSSWANLVQAAAAPTVTLQFVAPYGVIESSIEHVANANASATGSAEGGFTFDLTFDLTFAGGGVIGETTVTNVGNADSWPLLRIYGPCTNPTVRNQTTGQELSFLGLTINAGEFLEINTRARTVLYLGSTSQPRYQYLDFSTSEWWSLHPGVNVIRFTPDTYSVPATLEIDWRDAWL
jgi:hypothetical protein